MLREKGFNSRIKGLRLLGVGQVSGLSDYLQNRVRDQLMQFLRQTGGRDPILIPNQ
jgi:hypothetical protein